MFSYDFTFILISERLCVHSVRILWCCQCLNVAVHGDGGGGAAEALDLGAREVLRESGQLGQVHVRRELPVARQLRRVDLQDLQAARLVRQADLHLHLEAARPQQRLVDHVLPIGHPYVQFSAQFSVHAQLIGDLNEMI